MPQINIVVPEVTQNVTRPLVLDVVRQIKKVVGIPQAAPIIYLEESEERFQPGSTLNPEDVVDISNRKNLEIEVTEELEDEFFTTQASPRPVELVDFFDPKLGINIRPVYKQSTFRVRFTYTTPNASEAITWRNRAQSMASRSNVTALHSADYHYFYSDDVWKLLHHLYTLREQVAPYGETWDQYVTQHITSRAVMIASQDGKELLGIRETQMRIQGEFDFRAEPEKVNKDQDKGYKISFTYTFQAARPEETTVTFPIIVHNQVIEEKYIPMEEEDHEAKAKRSGSMTKALHHFEAMSVMDRIPPAFMERPQYMPVFDSWRPDTRPPHTFMVASLLTTLDETDVLLNLRDLHNLAIDDDILEFIADGEHEWVTKLHCSTIQIALYRNECLQAWDNFEVRANLDVVLKIPKDLRARYRVCVFITKDITKVDYRAIKRLAQYPKAACKIFTASGANSGKLYSFLPHVRLDNYLGCVRIGGYSRQSIIDSIVWQKTVMNMYPEANRIESLAREMNLPKLLKK